MIGKFRFIIASIALLALVSATSAQVNKHKPNAQREVAVTFDDLPAPKSGVPSDDVGTLRELTGKLLESFTAHKVPVVGFVNEGKIDEQKDAEARIELLKMWLDAGMELGNHTFSHPAFQRTPLEEYEQNLIRGETLLKLLLKERGQTLRYFRHPFLQVGPNLKTRREFEKFLAARGYRIAPVTVDGDDYMFAAIYARAKARGDKEAMQQVAQAYLKHMDDVFDFSEKASTDLNGYEIKQVLLLHANALNADYFDDLASMMKNRGYKFITLDQALQDKAYGQRDDYFGEYGATWLHHWAKTRHLTIRNEPPVPEFVLKQWGEIRRQSE
ncbi:MAG: polysaccharide deacetylase family protein [Pyrinomonadaceae bacterium]